MFTRGPSSGSIVGRADAVRGLAALVAGSRLVTLIGPGGVGKSTLAAELVDEIEPEFGRVVVVPLADADDEPDLVRVVAAALAEEVDASLDGLFAAIAATPTLLVLDNCEHLIEAVARLVTEVGQAAATTTVVATSRRPLDLIGEAIWPVLPLVVPDEAADLATALTTSSVELFVERARRVVPTFRLGDDNVRTVVDICRLADGVPLVLELAAALVRSQPLDEIRRVMTASGVEGLTRDRPDHHRSVAASLDWSRRFLDPADLAVFDRLSVFVGGFSADAVGFLVEGDGREILQRLVDHSLVQFEPSTGRYRILEPVRRDSMARLDSDGLAVARTAHAAYCDDLVARIDAARHAPDPDNVFPRFWAEAANLQAALRHRRTSGDLDGYRSMVGPIAPWIVHYIPTERPTEWEPLFADPNIDPSWRASVQLAMAFHASHRNRHVDALRYAEAAMAHIDDDDIELVFSYVAQGNAHAELGAPDAARAAYRRVIEISSDLGEPYPEMIGRVSLARIDPDDPETVLHLEDALEVARSGYAAVQSSIAGELARHRLRHGRPHEAARLADEAVEVGRRTTAGEILASALLIRAEVAIEGADIVLADQHLDEALGVARVIGHGPLAEQIRATRADVRQPPASSPTRLAGGLVDPLSDRELAVLRLLRGDLTQREIGDELYIAASTVKTHIKAIYRKLGVGKRSHAITRAAELGLFD
ncbi:MAG: LuxR C-terminal-related transcriptional regulator [Actinomycetota bacterium]